MVDSSYFFTISQWEMYGFNERELIKCHISPTVLVIIKPVTRHINRIET